MTSQGNANPPREKRDSHRVFLRDAIVFQCKLVVDGLRDVVLFPVAIVAAAVDVIKGDRDGRRFYEVVHFGRQTEQWIDLFEAADRAPQTDRPRPTIDLPSVDEFADRLENSIRQSQVDSDARESRSQT